MGGVGGWGWSPWFFVGKEGLSALYIYTHMQKYIHTYFTSFPTKNQPVLGSGELFWCDTGGFGGKGFNRFGSQRIGGCFRVSPSHPTCMVQVRNLKKFLYSSSSCFLGAEKIYGFGFRV